MDTIATHILFFIYFFSFSFVFAGPFIMAALHSWPLPVASGQKVFPDNLESLQAMLFAYCAIIPYFLKTRLSPMRRVSFLASKCSIRGMANLRETWESSLNTEIKPNLPSFTVRWLRGSLTRKENLGLAWPSPIW
jgi:hypothetical protein